MRYVASVIVDGVEEAGIVTNLFNESEAETFDPRRAVSAVVECSRGSMVIDLGLVPIFTVH